MCGPQLGIPLNDQTLAEMSQEERNFWLDFLEEASDVIEKMADEEATQPFTPPASLLSKYNMAVARYDGRAYCQILQLEEIFNFHQTQT
ncbi:MAG: hypothetical protein WC705_03120 [Candidatus Paceibacterota bacterium]|jgi:hypothetical protein